MAKNYEMMSFGSLDSLVHNSYTLPDSEKNIAGKIFANDFIKLTGCEISFNAFKRGQFLPFDHIHINYEQTYIFLSGQGEFEVDGEKFEVKEGSVINLQPEVVRNLCNTSDEVLILW